MFTLFSINCYISITTGLPIKTEGLAFFYKWVLPFIILLLLDNFYKSEYKLELLYKHLIIFASVLSIWTILYTPLLLSGYIQGNFRPSYPFSDDFNVSDAHVLSSCLGILFISIYFLKESSFKAVVLILILVALLMSGSRTGVLLVIIMFSANIFRSLFLVLRSMKASQKSVFYIFGLFAITIISLQFNLIDIDISSFSGAINRATDINVSDGSADGRIRKLKIALSEFGDYTLLGKGVLTATLTWYDGLFSIIIVHGGICFLAIVIAYIYMVFSQHRKNWGFLVTFCCFIISNLITEHLLITRYIIPVMICLWLLSKMESKVCEP